MSKPYAIAATRVSATADPRRYHVLSGKVLSSDLSVGLEAETLQGSNIEVTSLTPPTINDDSVIGPADVLATNGGCSPPVAPGAALFPYPPLI